MNLHPLFKAVEDQCPVISELLLRLHRATPNWPEYESPPEVRAAAQGWGLSGGHTTPGD